MLRFSLRRFPVMLLSAVSTLVVVALAVLGAAPGKVTTTAALPADVMAAGKAIAPARLEGHVRVLADDKLEGRGTGTRGYDMAAAVRGRADAGDRPRARRQGGYLQPVPFVRGDLKSSACSFALVKSGETVPLAVGSDVILSPDYLRTKWTTEAPLVFARLRRVRSRTGLRRLRRSRCARQGAGDVPRRTAASSRTTSARTTRTAS